MQLGMIWAQDQGGVIGDGNSLLWRVPADFKHFRQQTMGCPIIMGRKTWESLGGPLPGRSHLVLTKKADICACNCALFDSLEDALSACEGQEKAWIVGGAQVYQLGLKYADFLSVSTIELDLQAQSKGRRFVYAPEIDPQIWQLDDELSDSSWREKSGDARWKLSVYRRK